jgi:hypothetical protein
MVWSKLALSFVYPLKPFAWLATLKKPIPDVLLTEVRPELQQLGRRPIPPLDLVQRYVSRRI